MKIAYLSSAYSIHTVRWVNEMARRGYEVHLITLHPPSSNNPIDNRVSLYMLPISSPSGYFLNKWSVKKLLKRIDPNLIHTHYASGYGTLSRLVNFHPTLLSVWGSDVFNFPYQAKWKQKTLRLNLASADYIASTSCAIKKQTEKFVNPKFPITITPFGIDCDKFKPLKRTRNSDEFIVGTVKKLEERYGIEYLIRAFAIVKKKCQGASNLKLLIAGEGSLKNRLRSLAGALKIINETEFLGSVPHNEVSKILNEFSVYVAISKNEGFGVSILEASACGLPVVVSDVEGLPEIVQDGITGIIVPAGNVELTTKAIMQLIEDEELREKMGIEGRNFVLKNYEWNKSVLGMEKLYKRIIKD